MKETLLSFSNSEIHCQDIFEAKSEDERKIFFGIDHVLALFVVCNLAYSTTG